MTLQPHHFYMILGLFFVLALIMAVITVIKYKKRVFRQQKRLLAMTDKAEQIRQILGNADEGIIVVQNLKARFANKRIFQIMGAKKGWEVFENPMDYIHPDDMNTALDAYEKTLLSQGREICFRTRLITPEKNTIPVYIRANPFVWKKKPATLMFVRDMTVEKRMARDMEQVQKMEAIGILTGGIAHEFNNILTTIIGTADLALLDLNEEEPFGREFEQIRASGYRARNLVLQILSISRERRIKGEALLLTPVIKEAVKLLRSTLPSRINIVDRIDEDLNPVKADLNLMYQVFMSLCAHAVTSLEKSESPCLCIELHEVVINGRVTAASNNEGRYPSKLPPGKYIKLSVKDNGTEIDPDIRDRIFEPGSAAGGTRTGDGSILAAVPGIVTRLGGHISHESEAGEGNSFTIRLPVQKTGEEDNSGEKRGLIKGGGNILLVNDEQEISVIEKKMFTQTGYSVEIAGSGEKALAYFSKTPHSYDIMIADLPMNAASPEKLVKEVLSIREDFPVIVCSAQQDIIGVNGTEKKNAAAYITKPYNLKDLSALVAKHIL